MRIRLILVLVVLLSSAQVALSRDSNLRSCTKAELASLAEMRPTFDALIMDGQIIQSRTDFRAYITDYFTWREDLRVQTPHCAEMFEIALLMNQIASNQVARAALDRALQVEGQSTKTNPFVFEEYGEGNLPDRLMARIEMTEANLSDAERNPPEEYSLPPCTDADLDIFYAEVFERYYSQLELFSGDTSLTNLLNIIETQLPWREQVWASLPACENMYELTWLMTQAASDMVVLLAFYLADMKPQFELYNEETARLSATIAQMAPAFLGEAVPDATPTDSSLPGCAESQLKDFPAIIMEYAQLASAAGEIASFDDVLALGQRQFDWREKRFSDWPPCAEALELGLLIDQSTSDVVLVMAMLLAGVEEDDIPHMAAMHAGSARISALVTPILQGERAGTDTPVSAPLPECTSAQLAVINNEVKPDFWAIMDASSAVETIQDLIRLDEMQIAFRENVWSRLPACAEAYDIAWLMYRVTGDDVLTWALLAAGANEEDIPQSASTLAGIGRLNTMLAEIGEG